MKHFANCRSLFAFLLHVWREITGRSRIAELEVMIVLNKIRTDEDMLTLAVEIVKIREAYSIISQYNDALQNKFDIEQNKFFVLIFYVNAIMSAINGTKTVISIELGIEADKALQTAIISVEEQNSQLLAARVRVSKLEVLLAEQLMKTKNLDGES